MFAAIVDARVGQAEGLTFIPIIQETVLAANLSYRNKTDQEIQKEINFLDQEWIKSAGKTERADQIGNNDLSFFLKTYQGRNPEKFGEIFITDIKGAVVGMTNPTSDYDQGDEGWWEKSFDQGRGKVFIDNRGYDKSVGDLVFGIAVPIKNAGVVIGILKLNYKMNEILALTSKNVKQSIESFFIADSLGRLIISAGTARERELNEKERSILKNNEEGWTEDLHNQRKTIMAYKPIPVKIFSRVSDMDPKTGISKEEWFPSNWVVFMELDRDVAFTPIRKERNLFLGIGLSVLIGVVLLSRIIAKRLSAPIETLVAGVRNLGKKGIGQRLNIVSKDEFSELTTAFNDMIVKLDKITVSRDNLDTEIHRREQSDEKIRTLSQAIEQSPVSVIITNADAEIEYVNKTFENTTGYRAAEVMGQNPRLLKSGLTPKNRYKALWQAITSSKPWQGELQNKKRNGEIFWEHAHITPVLDESGVTRHYIAVKEDITHRKQQEERLVHQAHFDALTDLPNRFLSLDRLSQLLNEAQRSKTLVAILFLDLDDFKKVNDTMGHEAGDKILFETAGRLHHVSRSADTIGRLGGDEFIILVGGLTDAADARPVVENLIAQFRAPFNIDGRELILTASVGIALFPEDGNSTSDLLRNADAAMYHAKELGRNTYAYFTDAMNREASRRLVLEEQMLGALDRGEFSVSYQPQVDAKNGRAVGAEALLRWTNPALGSVSPSEFVPVAEKTGFIVPLGQFVLTKALAICAHLQQEHDPGFRMAVNLSPLQFRDPDLLAFIEKALDHSGVSGACLELEITEGVLMSGHAYIDEILASLSNRGVNISMDDFGTGYSSLSYLRAYPFDVLKIDQSFVRDISVDPEDQALIDATIAMAHGLNLKVVAEGVETEAQLTYLKKRGCDYAQGYLFAKPMPEDELLEWAKNWEQS